MVTQSLNANALYVASMDDVHNKLGGARPTIFLSAAVPYVRTFPSELSADELARRKRENEAYLREAAPEETVRSAVVLLAREILLRGMRLVFGAQPAIGAMVLSLGRDVIAAANKDEPRILIFQSRYFETEFPGSTLDLATWDAGLLVLTPEATIGEPHSDARRNASLLLMREWMVSVPNIQAGIFVGGMEGVREEAALFNQLNPGKPMFPLASTGAAARLLRQEMPELFAAPPDLASPDERISYSLVAKNILDTLEFGSGTKQSERPAGDLFASSKEEKQMQQPVPLNPDHPAVMAHISMLQGIINRLAGNSASCKTWCIALVSAMMSLASATKVPSLAVVGIVSVFIFGYLDASYLAQERAFRNLMKSFIQKLRAGKYTHADVFETECKIEGGERWRAFWSWPVAPMYVTLILLAIGLFAAEWFGLIAPAIYTPAAPP